MLRGQLVALRPVRREELPTLYAWRQDLDLLAWTDTEPWVALSYEDWSKQRDERTSANVAFFGIQEGLAQNGRLIGTCELWGIDQYNRNAHIGIKLAVESDRGKGYGREALALLVNYAFAQRGLHRVQLETFTHNTAMRRCAEDVGFREEGRLRESGWSDGRFNDDVIYGLLAAEWSTRPSDAQTGAAE